MNDVVIGYVRGWHDRWTLPGVRRQEPTCGVVGCREPAYIWVMVIGDRAKQKAKVLMQEVELNLCAQHGSGFDVLPSPGETEEAADAGPPA